MTALKISAPQCVAPMGAKLGEGPLWDPRSNRLLWLDIKGEKIFEYDPEERRTRTIRAPGMVSALGLAEDGFYVCARKAGFARLRLEGDAAHFDAIAEPEADVPGNRFNDGKADPLGGFWAGTMDGREGAVTGVWWRLAPDGSVARLDDGYTVTNGPAFDAARRRVYVTDSAAQTVFAAGSDGGALADKRVFLQFGAEDGYPDGMDVDAEGCLWIAFWDGAAVRRFSPDGALLETVKIDAPRPTSVKLVADRLYITTASIGLSDEAMQAHPSSGGLFEAALSRPLGVEADWFKG